MAERLRQGVEAMVTPSAKGDIRYTISIGVTEMRGEAGEDMEIMLNRADNGLYKAKAGGRNRVVVA